MNYKLLKSAFLTRLMALTVIVFLGQATLYGQWTYTSNYFTDAGNPGGINSEGDAPGLGTWTDVIVGPLGSNAWSPAIAIPFPFDFYGNPVTTCYASQNGIVTFSFNNIFTLPPNVNYNLPAVSFPDTSVGFWDEFTANPPTGSGDNIRTNTFGTAPNRQFWIKWYSFEMGNPTNSFSYFAIVLEETTNKIYVVDQYSTTSTLTATVGMQLDPTTAYQHGDSLTSFSSNGSANTDNDYWEFIPELLVPDNAGISNFDNPFSPLTPGVQNIDVTVENFGTNTLDSVNVDWEIDGTAQTPLQFVGPLAALTGSPNFNLGSYNFPNGFTTLKAWTSMPNGTMDSFTGNDTLEITLCTSLDGVYTVGAAGDFTSISEAVDALVNCGVSGPVTINIEPGTYTGGYILPEIIGASATNTITFDGGDAATTILTHDAVGLQAVWSFQGGDYFTLKNMTIQNTGTTDAWGVHLKDQSNFNMVDSCVFDMHYASGLFDVIAIVGSNDLTNDFSEGDNCNFCSFTNNYINGGEMGFHFEGLTTVGSWMQGIHIANNVIDTVDDYGIYVDNQDSLSIVGNTIKNTQSAFSDGIYCFDILNFYFTHNDILAKDYGMYVADGNFDAPVTSASLVANNMVKSTSDYAMYFDDVNDLNIYHNTNYGLPAIRINDNVGLDIRNNMFFSEGDYAFESDDAFGANISADYNLYWTPASNALFAKEGFNTYTDLSLWQAANATANVNSVELEPFFAAADDLHIVGANGNDIGDNTVGITDDIDGDTRPLAPSTIVDMGADEFTPATDDAEFTAIVSPGNFDCGNTTTVVEISVLNLGLNPITSLPITIEIWGDVNDTVNFTYPGNIAFGESDTIAVTVFDSYDGGNVNIGGYLSLAGDSDNSNDTIAPVSLSFIPFEPAGIDNFVCGVDSGYVYADTSLVNSYLWFDAMTGGTQVGMGSKYMVPSISAQDTYYLEYNAFNDTVTTTYAAGNGCGGGNMFDVNSTIATSINGFCVNADASITSGSTFPVTVHYITGSSYVGNETNAGAWTSAGSYTVTSAGNGNPSCFNLTSPINIPAGTTVAIYVEYNADYTNGTLTYTNGTGQISLTMGAGLCSSFGGVNNGRMFNGSVQFGATPCSAIRTPVAIESGPVVEVDLGADTTVCGNSLTLDAGATNAAYQIDWSTSDTTQMIDVNMSNDYFVSVVDTASGCNDADTIALIIDSLMTDLGADFGFCEGVTVTLDAGAGFPAMSYAWSNGDTTQTTDVTLGDDYFVTVSDTFGCSDTDSISLYTESITVDLGVDLEDCDGITFNLDAGAGATSYDWSTGDTTQTLSVVAADEYYVTVATPLGCEDSDTINVSVIPLPDANATITGDTTDFEWSILSTSSNYDSLFIDFGDGNTSNDSNATNIYANPGVYTACLYVYSDCGVDSICQDITIVDTASSIRDITNKIAIAVYPNPAKDQLTIGLAVNQLDEVTIEIFSVIGNKVSGETINTLGLKQITQSYDVAKLAAGTYLVKVSSVDGYVVKTFVKE